MNRACVGLLLSLASELAAQTAAPGSDAIRKEALKADLYFLASDELRGRLTEDPENRIAALFIRSRFERLGLKPMGLEDSYFQSYVLSKASLGQTSSFDLRAPTGATLTYRLKQDFVPQSFSASGTVEGEVVFAGYGIRAAKLGHDDFKGDVFRGKIALVFDHEPGEKDRESAFDGEVASEYARDLRKALYAQSAGALAILFVADVHNHPGEINFSELAEQSWPATPRRMPRLSLARWTDAVRIPAVAISPTVAAAILAPTGKSLEELARLAEVRGGAAPIPVPGLSVALTASVAQQAITDRNVVAAIEGSDARLKDEWVVVCAHYDHDGADEQRIFNGADDDGSGTVALLAIAEAYAEAARQGARPRRSVLFAAWNSEERGLLGAWAYAESPLVPLERTIAALNMDMIGRNEEVPVGGGRRFRGLEVQTAESNRNRINILGHTYSRDLTASVEESNRAVELELLMRYDNNESNLLRRSDQWPFLQKGVPSLFFHTGLHPDYHTEFDRPEKIEYDKLERIARLVHQTSWDLAMGEGRPKFDLPERAAAAP
ncbi:MAG TPA: M28 family peptidase [Vicinamibacteria bacterium]|nr:M28 family peptidase [Vicinamibacteria bacterium]